MGSIKSIIGHTEGTAGVAGVLKAVLAVQHKQIPANLHFKTLNPKVKPYYKNLRIPTETLPWPSVPPGCPRRVSVNSFGFGGTNAHAIIESWDADGLDSLTSGHANSHIYGHTNGHATNGDVIKTSTNALTSQKQIPGPFILSANSTPALAANASALASYLRAHPDTQLSQLAYSLFRKTDFSFRAAFSATSPEQLADKLEAAKDTFKSISRTAPMPETLPPRILGVFTGQGAQWATMGKELYLASDSFRSAIDGMQYSLDTLPEQDRPDWTLIDQLNAPKASSRAGEAVVSQPLCTALQVALVDALRAVGINFSAVVGHSSGEIGAAYAAGYLNATDAIRVAYYRGHHCHLAHGPGGKRGKMMAVGMPLEEATTFCGEFEGMLAVAASNSQTSCTLAGDAEAIDNAHAQLEEKGTFARVLQVDTAYHSHHMKPCGIPYLESMKQCGIKVQKGRKRCPWYSSVFGSNGRSRSFDQADALLLEGKYWVDNMTQAVLFSQAVARALEEDQVFDLALEVGPHPALKGPASETIKMLTNFSLPYSGVLKRGQNAQESFADALGLLWKSFPSPRPMVTFDGIRRAFHTGKPQKLSILKGLPAYSWDHPSLIWKESRASRIYRTQSQARHELLGHSVTHGERDKREVHWKHILRLSELPWLAGHRIQGQVLFPASGYLSMTYEAAIRLVDEQQPLRLVELHDIEIVRAMIIEEDSSGLEVVFTIRVTSQSSECVTAEVACYSGPVDAVQPLDVAQTGLTAHFTGGVRLWLGEPRKEALPLRTKSPLPLDALDMDHLYSSLSKEGFNYTEDFQAKSMLRRLDRAEVLVSSPPESNVMRKCIHPAPVDTAFQGLLAAFSFPGDGRVGSIYLPTKVESVRISMQAEPQDSVLTADAIITSSDKTTFTGDVDLFDATDAQIHVQIRGIHLTAVGQRREPWLYAGTTWARDAEYGLEPGYGATLSDAEHLLSEQLTRTAYFYLRQLRRNIRKPEMMLMGKYRKLLMTWVLDHLFPKIEAGEHADIRPEWESDTREMLDKWRASQPSDNNDMNVLHALGKNLVNIVRGTISPFRVLTQDGMLDRLYVEGLGPSDGNVDLGAVVNQLAHHHPRMRIVEIGAGTGGSTRAVLRSLEGQFASYTYTDISTGFFENARTELSQHSNKLVFKTLNIDNDPAEQGFANGTFDMVVASNSLHLTQNLGATLRHVRQLLRPGGRLVLLEITKDFLPMQLVMSTLPGWFNGIDDGRVWAPTISVERWDELLKANGFSGIDLSSTPSFCSVMVTQAVDETVQLLREPLAVESTALLPMGDILIVGGGASAELAYQTQEILRAAAPQKSITVLPRFEGIQVSPGAAVLSLSDLDSPVFRDMNQDRFKGLQNVMDAAQSVLWVTSGAQSGQNPDANLAVGLSSTIMAERVDLRLQFFDIDDPISINASMLAKMLLRLAILDPAKAKDLLWTQEPELALKNGVVYTPRVQSLKTINHRSAARRKQVTQLAILESKDTAVMIDEDQGAFELQVAPVASADGIGLRLQITASSLRALTCVSYGALYVCIGRELASGDKILALSKGNSSVAKIANGHVLSRLQENHAVAKDTAKLHLFLVRAIAEHLLNGFKGPTWIHGAPQDLSDALELVASEKNISLFQTTSDLAKSSDTMFIHPFASKADLQNLRPKGLQSFVNLANPQHETLSALVRTSLPASAVVDKSITDLFIGFDVDKLRSLAERYFHGGDQPVAEHYEAVAVNEVSTVTTNELGPTAVVDWNVTGAVSATVRPLNHSGLFDSHKTYLLCGMTGDLGISVCLWMVENGARNVVLTSRSPKVSPSVLQYLSSKGANVRPMVVDIANIDSLRSAYTDIKASMPPVGGVMNAAMVLRDRLFSHMLWEEFAAVLAPKVMGSKNLDEVFGDEALEFFVCFSSTTSIAGSIGQSAYAAANHYMASLVRQRHRRGLAGSAVHLALLTGFGYISRIDTEHADTIYKALSPRLDRQSETDLHEILAEAIVCGRPGSDERAELITGLKTVFQDDRRDDPRLSCYTGQQQLNDDSNQGNAASISVKAQLNAAEDPAECLSILEKCFANALGNLLEIDAETLDSSTSVASLGIDSLIAIRVREWFLKELGVDVPVLKVMSDTYSMSRMCDDVLVGWRKLNQS